MITRHPDTLQTKSKTHEVARLETGAYQVTSGTTGNIYYVERLAGDSFSCTCDWSKYRPAANNGACGCSHVLAVVSFEQAENRRTMKAHADYQSATRQHRKMIEIGDGLILTTRKVG